MIEIRYSEGEVDLQGSPAELRAIRQAIFDLLRNDRSFVRLAAATDFDPTPYSRCLKSLTIRQGRGPAKVAVSGDSLEVGGGSENLETFAEWLDFPDEGPSRYHCHFEYYEGNEWITANSLPLVISVSRADAA